MKEIETLVEEKTKESLDVSRLTREGERTELRAICTVAEAARQVTHTLGGQHPRQHHAHCGPASGSEPARVRA